VLSSGNVMKQVILGTAGHIDHGKTALVKALTGIDTDRLKEEKERGITIELGFAHLDLPSGRRVGIVDVPGHERFVKHMVAGAAGVDLVALIIAADEGVMPQTREHLDICSLLGVKKGLVVITKVDLVDEELLELAKEEVKEFLRGTFLEGAPVVAVSAVTGQGLDELVQAIDRLVEEVEEKPSDGLFRLPIDRVFTMRGFGTVVTGTLISGEVSVGDPVEVLPSSLKGKVRGLQVHKEKVQRAVAGQRTAINISGVDKDRIDRGDVLLHPGTVQVTDRLDVEIYHLPSVPRPLKNGVTLRFHIGTSLEMAKVILLGTNQLEPGERGYAQVRLERPVVALPYDRFVLRGSGTIQTWGGGVVLDAHPERHKRFRPEVIEQLDRLRERNSTFSISFHLQKAGPRGMPLKEMPAGTGLRKGIIERTLEEMTKTGEVVLLEGGVAFHRRFCDELRGLLLEQVQEFHRKNPMRPGISREELKGKLPEEVDPKLYSFVLEGLIGEGRLESEKELVRIKGHRISLSGREAEEVKEVEEAFRSAGLTPPTFKELLERQAMQPQRAREILSLLVHEGKLVKVKEDLYFHREPLEGLKERLVAFLKERGKISTQEFKNLTGTSRKYAIPLAEYFDSVRLTLRVGDERVLRGK